jgi:hypothetical protein
MPNFNIQKTRYLEKIAEKKCPNIGKCAGKLENN